MGAHIEIRPLSAADALACDAIVASLAYHFANDEGRAEPPPRSGPSPGWSRWWTGPSPGS
jgi:hypothetical protein